jgi:hypothetical protein
MILRTEDGSYGERKATYFPNLRGLYRQSLFSACRRKSDDHVL